MEQFIGCDPHKKFSVFVAVNEKGHVGEAIRVAHDREAYRKFLARLPPRSVIAVEASGRLQRYPRREALLRLAHLQEARYFE